MDADALRAEMMDAARRDFRAYFTGAAPADEALMEALLLARQHLRALLNAPRRNLSAAMLTELERATNIAEHFFTEMREEMRGGAKFAGLAHDERTVIERSVFDVVSPLVE